MGTTVRITDFLKSIPVRRQTALKDSAKQLAKIKRNLQAYALARPSVRLSLKVLKAKTDNGNWIYAPKSNASVLDAAVKVVGKKVTDQSRWLVWTPNTPSTEAGATQGDGTTASATTESTHQVEALLPISDAGESTSLRPDWVLLTFPRSHSHHQCRSIRLCRFQTSFMYSRYSQANPSAIQVIHSILLQVLHQPEDHRSFPMYQPCLSTWKLRREC